MLGFGNRMNHPQLHYITYSTTSNAIHNTLYLINRSFTIQLLSNALYLHYMHLINYSAYIKYSLLNIIGKTMKQETCLRASHAGTTDSNTSSDGSRITHLNASMSIGAIYADNIVQLSQKTYNEPKLALYSFESTNILSSLYGDANKTEHSYYIFGEEVSINRLINKYSSMNISIPKSHDGLEPFSKENTIFLSDGNEHITKFYTGIQGLGLDESTYNLQYTTIDIDTGNWNSFYDPDDIIYNKRKITKESSNKHYNNAILEFECLDGKYDFAYDKSLTVIGAQTGQLKSTLLQNIIGGYVSNSSTVGLNYLDEHKNDYVVLLFDTETSVEHLRQKWDFYTKSDDRIEYFSFKSVNGTDMYLEFVSIINSVIKRGKSIRAIFLDSLMDFISDFNNIQDAKTIIDRILKITEDLEVPIFISYQENTERNYGAVSKLSGHLGSQLQQKAEAHYRISINGDTADLTCIKNRYSKKFDIQFDISVIDNFVVLISTGLKAKKEKVSVAKLNTLIEGLDAAFNGQPLLTSDEMDGWIKTTLDVKLRSAQNWKSKLEKAGEIKSVVRGKFTDWERV